MGWCNDIRFPKNITNLLKLKKKLDTKNLKEKTTNTIY